MTGGRGSHSRFYGSWAEAMANNIISCLFPQTPYVAVYAPYQRLKPGKLMRKQPHFLCKKAIKSKP
jgi:hypothetical protein